jgi:ADP-ribosylglycohydrolase
MSMEEHPDKESEKLHHCTGYIENIDHLEICKETIQRANNCGFKISDFADCCLKAINHNISSTDNGYDDLAKVVESFAAVAILLLKKYQVKDVEVAHFKSNDTQEEFTVYLSEMHGGYIMVKEDENGEPTVRITKTSEIWRYLSEPLHVIEAVISAIIAYAEKHQSIKNQWLFTMEDIGEISRLTER